MSALIHQRCANHPGREAVVRCPECVRFFCRECVTEHLGRMICAGCVARLASAGTRRERSASAFWLILALGGFLLAWLVFYYLGTAMTRIPDSFHALLAPAFMSSRLHSLTVVVQKSLLNRARQQAEQYAAFDEHHI